MNNNTTIIITAIILVAGSFYAGTTYANGQRNLNRNARMGQFSGNNASATQKMNGALRMGQGGFVNGEIISKDETGIIIKLQDGGSKIIFLSEKTKISKLIESSKTDLAPGIQITGSGIPNPDGSITAESLQIK